MVSKKTVTRVYICICFSGSTDNTIFLIFEFEVLILTHSFFCYICLRLCTTFRSFIIPTNNNGKKWNHSDKSFWLRLTLLKPVIHVFKLEPPSGKTNDYKIGICCFSAKHAAIRRISKDWLARNHNNVSEWSDMSILELYKSNSACWSSTKRTSSPSHWKLICSRHDIAEKLLS
jgi:hypothetical protein